MSLFLQKKSVKQNKEFKKNQTGKINYWEETGVILYYIQGLKKKYTQECCEISKANQYGFIES